MSRSAVAAAAVAMNDHFDLPERYDPAVPLEQLVESGHNARRRFNPAKLEELAASIREQGIIEPLVVRPFPLNGDTQYEIVAGARRFRASKIAQRTAVPCVIREYSDGAVLELQIIENIQREDLDPLEEAAGYHALIESDKSRYSAAFIANRIGRSEKYVWDTLRLLNLIPDAQQHLEHGRITRSHAVLLARLTPKQQATIIDPVSGGLFVHSGAELRGLADDVKPGKYDGLKAVSVKELEHYIADHVRFDVKQLATTAPLEFGETAQRIEAAQAKPGRGKKVISIHYGHHVQDSAKDASGERTFGHGTWKRADGQEGSKRCESSVLGVVAVGLHYGQAFEVCIAKDSCDVHWKQERRDRERTQQLRASGKTAQADKREEKIRQERAAAEAKEAAERKRWEAARPAVLKAIAGKVKTVNATRFREFFLAQCDRCYTTPNLKTAGGLMPAPRNGETLLRLAVMTTLVPYITTYHQPSREFLKIAKQLGVDVPKILKAQAIDSEAAK